VRVRAIALLTISALAAGGCGKKKSADDKTEDKPAATAPGETATQGKKIANTPTSLVKDAYPATVAGLRDMMADFVRAHRRNETEARSRAEAVLALPGAAGWFNAHFPGAAAKHLLSEYQIYGHGYAEFPRLVADQGFKHGRKTFVVDVISGAGDPKAIGFQARALEAMTRKVPLYTFRLSGEGKADFVLYSFVHEGGTFRYVGRLARLDGKLPANHKDLGKTVAEIAAAKPAQ
jgi:hypothetical protein